MGVRGFSRPSGKGGGRGKGDWGEGRLVAGGWWRGCGMGGVGGEGGGGGVV